MQKQCGVRFALILRSSWRRTRFASQDDRVHCRTFFRARALIQGVELARDAIAKHGDRFLNSPQEEGVAFFAKMGGDLILKGIDQDLQAFGVRFDHWFSEQSLFDQGKVTQAIEEMQEKGLIYEQEGALWFRTTDYGDDKDRVVVRSNGVTTYFASDIAYHRDKFLRGFDWVIDVWGADHHGYVPRLKGIVQGLGRSPGLKGRFDIVMAEGFFPGQALGQSRIFRKGRYFGFFFLDDFGQLDLFGLAGRCCVFLGLAFQLNDFFCGSHRILHHSNKEKS